MTRNQARLAGKSPGYALRLDANEGLVVYLADFRKAGFKTTNIPSEAEYFERFLDAEEMALRVSHITGEPWKVTTCPADNSCNAWLEDLAPGIPTEPRWATYDLEPGLTPEEARLAFDAAVDAFAAELDDEDAELAAISHAYPAAASRVIAPEDVP